MVKLKKNHEKFATLNLKLKNLLFPVPIKSSLLWIAINLAFSKKYFLISIILWLVIFITLRLLLKFALNHKGLIIETRGKHLSLKTIFFRNILLGMLMLIKYVFFFWK